MKKLIIGGVILALIVLFLKSRKAAADVPVANPAPMPPMVGPGGQFQPLPYKDDVVQIYPGGTAPGTGPLGTPSNPFPTLDVNGDGIVNIADVTAAERMGQADLVPLIERNILGLQN